MELSELLIKEKEILTKKAQLKKELYELNKELDALYVIAWNEDFVCDAVSREWHKDINKLSSW